jgi:UDP-glucose 4-epimerase
LKKKFLVTGGAGFIGSHLVEALLAAGHGVVVLDDLSTGKRANLPREVAFHHASITDPQAVRAALAGADGCFHLAAIASVTRASKEWFATHQTNLGGLIVLFEAVRAMPAPIPVVYASSAAVYGDRAALPIVEDAAKYPLSAYGADKLGCESHAGVASHVHGIPTMGLRFFNVYGPRQDPGSPYSGVISIFCERILGGTPVAIFGDGGQTRDFIFVADVVAALTAAMTHLMAGSRKDAPVKDAPVFNVCTGKATSVRDLAAIIAELCGRAPDLRFAPARKGEIRHSCGAPEAGRAALGLTAPVPLKQGLASVLAWLDQASVGASSA